MTREHTSGHHAGSGVVERDKVDGGAVACEAPDILIVLAAPRTESVRAETAARGTNIAACKRTGLIPDVT